MTDFEACDAVIACAIRNDGDAQLSACPLEFRQLVGRGVTILTPLPAAESDEALMDALEEERTPVKVDIREVLADGLRASGFNVGAERNGFLPLVHPKISNADCEFFFELNRDAVPIEVRALSSARAVVVVHTLDSISPYHQAVLRSAGVETLRLRDFSAATPLWAEGVTKRADVVGRIIASVFAGGVEAARIRGLVASRDAADPALVETYASTDKDSMFEAATARILGGLLDKVLPLGGEQSGTPVPDGLLFHEFADVHECAVYDCKSKKTDNYDFPAGDGDQLARYSEILKVGEKSKGWKGRGVLLATPKADAAVLQERVTKQIWNRLDDRKLLVAPAGVLHLWHTFASEESVGARVRLDRKAVWEAMWDRVLPGIATSQYGRYFPDDAWCRVLSQQDGELIWLAGAVQGTELGETAFKALQETSTNQRIVQHRRADRILRFFSAVGRKAGATLDSIAQETELCVGSVKFLIETSRLDNIHRSEIGPHWYANTERLRKSLWD